MRTLVPSRIHFQRERREAACGARVDALLLHSGMNKLVFPVGPEAAFRLEGMLAYFFMAGPLL